MPKGSRNAEILTPQKLYEKYYAEKKIPEKKRVDFSHFDAVAQLIKEHTNDDVVTRAAALHGFHEPEARSWLAKQKGDFKREIEILKHYNEVWRLTQELEGSGEPLSEAQAEKWVSEATRRPYALLIHLAHSVHRLEGAKGESEKSRRRAEIAQVVYAPVAAGLTLYRLKTRLEDNAFRILEPEKFKELTEEIERHMPAGAVAAHANLVTDSLKDARLPFTWEVSGPRVKSVYSTYKKLRKLEKEEKPSEKGLAIVSAPGIQDIWDLMGMRIVLHSKKDADCFAAGKALEENLQKYGYQVAPYKDYVTNPKGNGFQALLYHVLSSDGKQFEVHIQTQEMYRHSVYGGAAHWHYTEEGKPDKMTGPAQQKPAIRRVAKRLPEWPSHVFPDLGAGEIAVKEYLPQGEVRAIRLPVGSTATDYLLKVYGAKEGAEKLLRYKNVAINQKQFVHPEKVLETGDTLQFTFASQKQRDYVPIHWTYYITLPELKEFREKIMTEFEKGTARTFRKIQKGKR